MSDIADHNELTGDELLAAEYALGVLAHEARTAAARRIVREPSFARRVVAWEARLAPWAGDVAPVNPPHSVWERINASLPSERGWLDSVAFWRGMAFGTGALAAACLGALLYTGVITARPPLVASLEGGGKYTFVATIDPRQNAVIVVPAGYTAEAQRVPELWIIPPGQKPRSLGLVDPDKPITLVIPPDLRAQATTQAVLAISLEPPGGSPTGLPTGPVIATGKLVNL